MPEPTAILEQLRRLLINSDNLGQARTVERLIELRSADPAEFNRLLQGVDMWGGSGAVWEVGPTRMNRDEVQSFRAAIIALAEWMESESVGFERSRFIADVFRKWNAAGI
ncbi:MAG TPA: hypothetical protein VMD30_11015 [Tepidisphaeraceae bacterium]|nr:hypothetical protein [Tepidisphaeraceae bacterium]